MKICLYSNNKDKVDSKRVELDGESLPFNRRWFLPHQEFDSLWENLDFDRSIKSQLMKYFLTLVRFNEVELDRSVVHCNQTIVLYGPPGWFVLIDDRPTLFVVFLVEAAAKRRCVELLPRKFPFV